MHMTRDEKQNRRADIVEPGLYRMSLIRNGWKVPCRIVQGIDVWWAEVNEMVQGYHIDPFDCPAIIRIHEWGEKVSDRQYDWLIGIKAWARQNDPTHPCLHPWTSMDPNKLRPLIPRREEWTPE